MSPALPAEKLGLLLTTGPDHPNFDPALGAIQAALARGASVYCYAIDEGVRCVHHPRVQALQGRPGFHLFACAYGAQRRGMPMDNAAAYSGLTVLADMIASTDRFIAFGDAPSVEKTGGARSAMFSSADASLAPLPTTTPAGSLPRTLVVISTDPRTSARAAEGIRIAAGVGAWKKTDVDLLLLGPAGYCLLDEPDDLMDDDNFTRYRPIIAGWGRPVLLDAQFGDVDVLEHAALPFTRATPADVAALYSRSRAVIEV